MDYVLPLNGKLIPVEVKAGASGRFKVEQTRTIAGKDFTLINIPWYQAARVEGYVELGC